ncbi:hypothetical protein PTI98_007982 [Pleurotus ostreatus]|nr:hypothetical protein PTI98_007982 [Pleurotus ostreatus]
MSMILGEPLSELQSASRVLTEGISPQTLFVLPEGLLRRKGTNTLALSLWSLDQEGASIAGLQLVADGSFETSLHFKDVDAPDFAAQRSGRPPALSVEPM